MERAATPGNLMETHIVVAAIASGLVGVIVVAMMIYLCCFNPRNKRLSSRTEVRPAESDSIKNDPNGVGDRITPRSKFEKPLIIDFSSVVEFSPWWSRITETFAQKLTSLISLNNVPP